MNVIVSILILLFSTSLTAQESVFWEKVNVPAPFNSGYYLDVYFLKSNPQYGWISGFNGYVLRTTDGGNTWEGHRAVDLGQGPMFESIHFTTPLIGYASGPNGIYKSTDGGKSWNDVTPPIEISQIWGCYFVDEFTGLFVGGGCSGDNQMFVRTSDGGITWNVNYGFENNSGMSDLILYQNDGIGYAVSSGVLWETKNGGKNWFVLSHTGPNYWSEEITHFGTSFLIPTAGVDCAGGNRKVGSVRFTTDRGGTWNVQQRNNSLFGAFLLSETKGWASGDQGEVIYTSDAGKTWEYKNCGLVGIDIDDLFFTDERHGWAVGDGVYKHTLISKPDSLISYPPQPICSDQPAQLLIPMNLTNVKWSTGESSHVISAKNSGKYFVSAYDSRLCSELRDTITITQFPKPNVSMQLSSDSIICEKDSVKLTLVGNYRSCTWSNASTQNSITVKDTGVYYVTIVDTNGCQARIYSPLIRKSDSPQIRIYNQGNSILCNKESTELVATQGFSKYLWSNGETTRNINVDKAGIYKVTVEDMYGCIYTSDSVVIEVLDIENSMNFSLISKKEFNFDSVSIGSDSCYSVTIHNTNIITPLIVGLPYIARNVVFSMPQSQFPLQIKPRDSVILSICFTPHSIGWWKDTIIFKDTCSPFILPLKGYGAAIDEDLTTRCTVHTLSEMTVLGYGYAGKTIVYPNPNDGNLTLSLIHDKDIESVSIVNAIGEIYPINITSSLQQLLTCSIPSNYPNGMYSLIIRSKKGNFSIGSFSLVQ